MSRTKRQKRRLRYSQVAIPPEVHDRARRLRDRLNDKKSPQGVTLWGVIARGLEALEEKLNGRE